MGLYFLSGLGVTVGFHRLFTHRSFTAVRPLRISLAVSMGESWHNLHHADPTCARHGVGRGQVDMSAHLTRVFEKLGWARDVRRPTTARLRTTGPGVRSGSATGAPSTTA